MSRSESKTVNHFSTIIVGSGLAGYTLARELRKLNPELSLLMLTRDDGAWYSKPMLSNGLAKNKSAAELATKSASDMAGSLDITILANTEVREIDPLAKTLVAGHTAYHYDSLVIATGAQQIVLPLEGDGAADVLSVNDLDDYARFRDRLDPVSRVAIMGPGLIGCEFANDLSGVGKTTIVIGPDSRPLERLIPEEASEALRDAMNSLDVEWHLNTVVTRIDREAGSGYRLSLSSGESVDAGLVLSAVGLKPDLTLAKQANLQVNSGVVCDQYLRTSDPSIYTLGDCAEIVGMVMPYIMPINHGAKALAKTLNGEPTLVVFPAMPVAIKTPIHPVVVASPSPGVTGRWSSEVVEGSVRSLFHDDNGELQGFVLTGSLVKEKVKLERQLPKVLE